MKKRAILLILALVVVVAGAAIVYPLLKRHYNAPKPVPLSEVQDQSELAPDFTVTDAAGESVTLSDFFGKPIVIHFWATWCGSCVLELPDFDSVYAQYGDDVQFLMVNMTDGVRETVRGVQRFLERHQYSFPVYYDTDYQAAVAYGIRGVPLTVFIGADGALKVYNPGMLSQQQLIDAIESLVK